MTTGIPPVGGALTLNGGGASWYGGAAFDPAAHKMYIGPNLGTNMARVNTDTFTVEANLSLASVTPAVSNGPMDIVNGVVYSCPANAAATSPLIAVPVNNFTPAGILTLLLSTIAGINTTSFLSGGMATDGRYLFIAVSDAAMCGVLRVDPNNFTAGGATFLALTNIVPGVTFISTRSLTFFGRHLYLVARQNGAGALGSIVRVDPNNFNLANTVAGPLIDLTALSGGIASPLFVGKSYTWICPQAPGGSLNAFDKRAGSLVDNGFAMANVPGTMSQACTWFDGRRYGYISTTSLAGPQTIQVVDEANPGMEQYFSLAGIYPVTNSAINPAADNNDYLYLPPNNPNGNTALIRFKMIQGRYQAGTAGTGLAP